MKTIRVVAAVIRQGNQVLATQKDSGEFEGKWEFPGGKIEENETPKQALKREIWEELNLQIQVNQWIDTIKMDHPGFRLELSFYWCHLLSKEMQLKEAKAARWLRQDELKSLCWLAADELVLPLIEKEMESMNEEDTRSNQSN